MKIDKSNISLVEIVRGEGVEIIEKRGYHQGCCPFHDDRTPSFFVYADNGYKCFGCGEHGDVITFIMKFKGIGFRDACRYLGIKLNPRDRTPRKKPKRSMIELIVKEEEDGVNVCDKYGKEFVQALLMNKLVKDSKPSDKEEDNGWGIIKEECDEP